MWHQEPWKELGSLNALSCDDWSGARTPVTLGSQHRPGLDVVLLMRNLKKCPGLH